MNYSFRSLLVTVGASFFVVSLATAQGLIKIKPGTQLRATPVITILPISYTPNFSEEGQTPVSAAISSRLTEAVKTMTLKEVPFSADFLSLSKVQTAMKSAGLEGKSFPLSRTNLDMLRAVLKVDRLLQLEVSTFGVKKQPSSIGLTKYFTQVDAKMWLSHSGGRSRTDFTSITATGGATSFNMSAFDRSFLAGKMSNEIVAGLKVLMGLN